MVALISGGFSMKKSSSDPFLRKFWLSNIEMPSQNGTLLIEHVARFSKFKSAETIELPVVEILAKIYTYKKSAISYLVYRRGESRVFDVNILSLEGREMPKNLT